MKKTEKILGIIVLSLMLFGLGTYISQSGEVVDSFANSNREEESTNTDENKSDAENYNTEEKSNTDEGNYGLEAFVMEVIEVKADGVNAIFVDFPESENMMFITHEDLGFALEVGDIIEMVIEEGNFNNVLKVSLYEGEGLKDRINEVMDEMFEGEIITVEKF